MLLAELPRGNPITFAGVDNIFLTIEQFLFDLSSIIAVIALILSGITMIWSRGEEKSFEKGKQMLKTTIYGAFVVAATMLILQLITEVFTGGFTLAPITDLIGSVVISLGDFVIGLSTVVMVVFIVISGIMMATARDDQAKFKKARAMLVNVIWGSLVIMGSGVILNTILGIVDGSFFCNVMIPIVHICVW